MWPTCRGPRPSLPLSAAPRVERGAELDPTGTWRYRLWRRWGGEGPTAVFVGLNPSTADAHVDDPTIRRCVSFAQGWGCSGLEVVNLFAYRATRPADLRRADDPVGPDNDRVLAEAITRGSPLIACWGLHGAWRARGAEIRTRLAGPWQCLGKTRDGHPRHPLYLRRDTGLAAY